MIAPLIHGLTRILSHCLFSWTETVDTRPERTFEIGPDHCEACVAELHKLYPTAAFATTNWSVKGVTDDTNTNAQRPGPKRGRG